MIKKLFLASVILAASLPAFGAAALDPTHAIGLMPDQIQWKKGEASDTACYGDGANEEVKSNIP